MSSAPASLAAGSAALRSLLPAVDAGDRPAIGPAAFARLALNDPPGAAAWLRDLFAPAPAPVRGELATAAAAGLDDPALHALARDPDGRALLSLIGEHVLDGPPGVEPRAQLARLREVLAEAGTAAPAAPGAALQRLLCGPAGIDPAAAFRTVREAGPPASGSASTPDAATRAQLQSVFKDQFAAKAADREGFHAFMQQTFGSGYDKGLAEQYRQRALAGDFGWLPEVRLVDAKTLGGGNGAYDAAEGVVYINRELAAADPAKAASTFVEEAGHHLDARLNRSDTQGDEGEMFRRVLAGERLSGAEVDAIRNENDKGTINVGGRQVEVEFWFGEDIVDGLGKAAKSVGNAVGDAAEAVGDAVGDAAKWTGNAVADAASWAGKGVAMVGGGVFDGVKRVGEGALGAFADFGKGVFIDILGGFAGNLLDGNVGEAFASVVRGVDRAVFQSTQRFFGGVIDGLHSAVGGVARALGPLGEPVKWLGDRVFDIGHTMLDTAFGIGRDAFRIVPDTIVGFVGDVERAVDLAADGRWGDAAKQLGMAFVNTPGRLIGPMVDMAARALRGAASVVLTAVDAEPPARRLNGDEIAYLKQIYGDSIDYDAVRIKPGGPLNDTARTVGNTVYMQDDHFNPDGTLTPEGLKTLGHEMGHVWQNQNGGGDYIHNALGSQAAAWIGGGNRNEAYDWREALKNGESFETMNDEQRAKLMEDLGVALAGKSFDSMSMAEQTEVIRRIRAVLAGGAPFESLSAAERTQLDAGIRSALAGGKPFGAMNADERARVLASLRTTFDGIASFAALSPERKAAMMAEVASLLADGRIEANDGIRGPTTDKPSGEGAYTPEEIAFLQQTWNKLKAGQGAG